MLWVSQPLVTVQNFYLDRRRDARKRQKLRQKNSDRGSGSADATEMFNDENLLANPEEEKPEPPPDFDEDAVKQKVFLITFLIKLCLLSLPKGPKTLY